MPKFMAIISVGRYRSAFLGHTDAEGFRETAFSRSGDHHGAAILHSFDPAEVEVASRKRRPYRPGDVRASFRPIDADFGESATGRTQRRKVDPELPEKTSACWGDFSTVIAKHDVFAGDENIS